MEQEQRTLTDEDVAVLSTAIVRGFFNELANRKLKRGPKVRCTCMVCENCKSRMRMQRKRAEQQDA